MLKHLFKFWFKTASILLFFFASVLLTCGQAQVAQAQGTENFYTALNSTYTIDAQGNTQVKHSFKIKNLTPEYYISRYSMKLGTDAVSNITVVSNKQTISPEINQTAGITEINIEFPDKLVGKDKVREFAITYSNPHISEVNGQTLETYLPRMNSEETYNEHKVSLVTPLMFGHPSRIKPDNYTIKQDGQNFVLTYENLNKEGVSAIYGSQQIYNLNIKYHLNNPNSQPAVTQVSLPPDTPYQKIYYQQLEPRPEEIKVDSDGNWIATYNLPANNVVEVSIQATVLVSLEQIQPWLNIAPIPEHTSSQPFWEITQPEIMQLATQHQTPAAIYQYTTTTLSYTKEDLSQKFDRLGASKAIKEPDKATCQEFSDLFITLARANNIPSRRVTGYAHSNDPLLQPLSLVTDVLHAWPEYYDAEQQIWIPIDPTWGNTMQGIDYFNQFDLKHIVFAYNGKSSRYPLAAGDYKLPNQESKDITVEFGQTLPKAEAQFAINFIPKKLLGVFNLPSWYELIIENQTGQAWYDNQLQITANDEQLTIINNQKNLTLLPWQKKVINIQVFNQENWLPKEDEVQLTLSNQAYEQTQAITVTTIKPVFAKFSGFKPTQKFQEFAGQFTPRQWYIFLGIFLGIAALTTGGILVFKRQQENSLRWQSQKPQKKS